MAIIEKCNGVDHVNPKSWNGDVSVDHVDLAVEWKDGQQQAEALLRGYFGRNEGDFVQIFAKPAHDLLRPLCDHWEFGKCYTIIPSKTTSTSSATPNPTANQLPQSPVHTSPSLSDDGTSTEEPSHGSSKRDMDFDGDAPLGMDFDDFLLDSIDGVVSEKCWALIPRVAGPNKYRRAIPSLSSS
ncbi:hypothetical protein FIBSPDRAFT_904041 [Athelia psychrophila]|uniref:Uncharacterized protein n=1 Tax=Athelia psychrophila TaxID=1759441 RepID=A0A167V8K2_9AGAM|nr:hypothetical protein FIBSPDRAFT_904041 [Fibularhizoctonia sp. CBS 109695]